MECCPEAAVLLRVSGQQWNGCIDCQCHNELEAKADVGIANS